MTLKFDPKQLGAYFVCGTQDLGGRNLETVVQTAIDAGITAYQYRDKGSSALTRPQRLDLGRRLQQRCAAANIPFIVDDDVEMALELRADGIHVGQKDDRVTAVIDRVAKNMFVGLSCSTIPEITIANEGRIFYLDTEAIRLCNC